MMLELAIAFKTESMNDADDGGRVALETRGKSAHAQKDIVARMLEDRANNFLALFIELIDTLKQIDIRTTAGGGHGSIVYTIT